MILMMEPEMDARYKVQMVYPGLYRCVAKMNVFVFVPVETKEL